MTIQTKTAALQGRTAEGITRLEAAARSCISQTRRAVDHALVAAKHKVTDVASGLRRANGTLGAQARNLDAQARRLAFTSERYARANPVRVAAYAAATGFFFALALRAARTTRAGS